jgi:hypothetical protein
LEVLQAAAQIGESATEIVHSTDPVVIRARDMVGLQVGVNLMDAGQLGPAVERLRRAVADVRRRGTLGLLPIGSNYLAQAELSIGDLDAAERTLRECAELPEKAEGGAWDAVNLAYLGWLMVVRHDDPEGVTMLRQARDLSARLWQANLAPLVANLYVDALLHGQLDDHDAQVAAQVLEDTIAETRRTGMLRSEVVSLSLLGRLRLARGEIQAALEASRTSVDILRRSGWALAAVNAEEILVHHALILGACGDAKGASSAIRRAAAEVRRKSRSLSDEQRDRYFENVPVNRLIEEMIRSRQIN